MGVSVSLLSCVMNPHTKSPIEVGSVCHPHQDASMGGMHSTQGYPPYLQGLFLLCPWRVQGPACLLATH